MKYKRCIVPIVRPAYITTGTHSRIVSDVKPSLISSCSCVVTAVTPALSTSCSCTVPAVTHALSTSCYCTVPAVTPALSTSCSCTGLAVIQAISLSWRCGAEKTLERPPQLLVLQGVHDWIHQGVEGDAQHAYLVVEQEDGLVHEPMVEEAEYRDTKGWGVRDDEYQHYKRQLLGGLDFFTNIRRLLVGTSADI